MARNNKPYSAVRDTGQSSRADMKDSMKNKIEGLTGALKEAGMQDNKALIGKVIEAQNNCIKGMIERDLSLCDRVDAVEKRNETSSAIVSELHKKSVERFDEIELWKQKMRTLLEALEAQHIDLFMAEPEDRFKEFALSFAAACKKLTSDKDAEIKGLKDDVEILNKSIDKFFAGYDGGLQGNSLPESILILFNIIRKKSQGNADLIDESVKLDTAIKEREAERDTFRDLYNEMVEAALLYNKFWLNEKRIEAPTHAQTVEGLKAGDLKDEITEKHRSKRHEAEKKYKRLVRCIEKNDKFILHEHRANEKKLKEKVK